MESLKFLMITTHYPPYHLGGDATFVEYLCRELLGKGHEVHVLHSPVAYRLVRNSAPPPSISEDELRPSIHAHKPSVSVVDPMLSLTLNYSPKAISGFETLARNIKPDVVHWHNTKGFIGRPIDTYGGCSLYTAHDYYAVCARSDLIRSNGSICESPSMCQLCHMSVARPPPIWRIGARRVIRFPKNMILISPSDFMAKRLREDDVDDVRTIRNFVPAPPQIDYSDNDTNEILYLGRLERHKGPSTLVRAFAESRERQGFTLKMIGSGKHLGNLQSMIANYGLGSRVRLPGFVSRDELELSRQRATAQVIPSEWYENAPLAALEGLARGTPMIGSNIGGIPEILTRDAGARLFQPGDAVSLGDLLVELWETRDSLQPLRDAARLAYDNRYTPEIHLKFYMETIRKGRRI